MGEALFRLSAVDGDITANMEDEDQDISVGTSTGSRGPSEEVALVVIPHPQECSRTYNVAVTARWWMLKLRSHFKPKPNR